MRKLFNVFERKKLRKALSVMMATVLCVGGLQIPQNTTKTEAATVIEDGSQYCNIVNRKRVTVHDPSIIKDPETGRYYIFGSHMAWAWSDDLETWTTFTNNINTNYKTLFKDEIAWSAEGDETYDASGNLWAPDVIYNPKTKKWNMYMSINGRMWNSAIALLEADSLAGDWTYVDTVVYSGFTSSSVRSFENTDYKEVTGDSSLPGRYEEASYSKNFTDADGTVVKLSTTWDDHYGAHAIDPCVFYDEEGKLWFAYGSWSGGIYIFELDETTGLRDKKVTYTYEEGVSDPYMGIKLGGSSASGEAAYIEYIDNYYYLFISYGGLVANGGYNMRVFRSENPDGPYSDVSGNAAVSGGAVNGNIGTRLMSYYKWSWWDYAHVAQGHNSAFVDDDGNAYVIYHTRTNDGTEGHTVRVHQLFTTENDYLVAAPFEYSKTDNVKTTYTTEEIAGEYEVIFQYNTDNAKLEYNEPKNISLNADGTVTGAAAGAWEEKEGTPFVTMTVDGVTYEGTFVEQTMEGTDQKTLCFTTVGTNDICLWGAKYPSDGAATVLAAEQIALPARVSDDIKLPDKGIMGTTITWKSGNPSILSDGTVIQPMSDREVVLTATVSKGEYSYKKDIKVIVEADTSDSKEPVKVASFYTEDALDLASGTTNSVANPLLGVDTSNGVKIKFTAKRTGTYNYLSNIFSFSTNNDSSADATGDIMYFTGGSYLGYNATTGTWSYFDANVDTANWVSGTDYIGQNKEVEVLIDLKPTGYSVSVDGELAYSNETVDAGETIGSNANITKYSNVLSYLSETAKYLNFGFGSWWKGTMAGTLSDFNIYVVKGEEAELGSNYYYAENYEGSTKIADIWSGAITATKETDNTNYVKLVPTGSGNRGAISNFTLESQPEGEYVFDTDVMLTSSTGGNGSTTPGNQFVLAGTDVAYTDKNQNVGCASGYILKLSASGVGNQEFTINDTEDTVTIPASTWVHITVSMNSEDLSKATLTITNNSTGAVVIENKEIVVNGSGELSGIYLLLGRGTNSQARLDNTTLRKPGIADYAAFEKAYKKAGKYVKQDAEAPVYAEEGMTNLKAVVTEASELDMYLDDSQQETVDAMTKKLNEAMAALVCIEHAYDEGEIIKKSTCSKEGTREHTCYYCGATKQTAVETKEHEPGIWSVTKHATTKTAGEKVQKCKNCDAIVKTEVIPKLTSSSSDSDETASSAIEIEKTYTVKNVKYKVTSTQKKRVTITGVTKKNITTVKIGTTVTINGVTCKITKIADNAFANCKKLKKVTIGTNVTEIGAKAFYKCSKLKKIVVKSKKITKVGKKAFKGIYKKATIKVPASKLKKYKKVFKKKGQPSGVKIKK